MFVEQRQRRRSTLSLEVQKMAEGKTLTHFQVLIHNNHHQYKDRKRQTMTDKDRKRQTKAEGKTLTHFQVPIHNKHHQYKDRQIQTNTDKDRQRQKERR